MILSFNNICIWQRYLLRNAADFDIVDIILFTAVGIGLVYFVDFVYRKVRKTPKNSRADKDNP
jgi:hypothetical protein